MLHLPHALFNSAQYTNLSNKTLVNITVFLIFLLFWLIILSLSGSLQSGFHLMTDHRIISFNEALHNHGFIEVFMAQLKADFAVRFRPFYQVTRLLEIRVLGPNPLLWSLYKGVLGALTAYLLFLFCSAVNFSILQSFLFPLFTLLGTQFSLWWKLGPAEAMGIFVLSIALCFLALYVVADKTIYQFFYTVFLVLSSLTKESFLLLMPAVLFLQIWLFQRRHHVTVVESIHKNISSMAVILICFAVEIVIIKYWIGTMKLGYAGFEGFNISKAYFTLRTAFGGTSFFSYYPYRWLNVTILSFSAFVLLKMISIVGSELWSGKIEITRDAVGEIVCPIVLFLLILIPQLLLYSKSGFYGRYVIPGFLAHSFLVFYSINRIYECRTSKLTKTIVLAILFSMVVCHLALRTVQAYAGAKAYANSANEINDVYKLITQKTEESDCILIILDPGRHYEQAVSVRLFLRIMYNRANTYIYPVLGSDCSEFLTYLANKRITSLRSEGRLFDDIQNIEEIRCVLIFPDLEESFIRDTISLFKEKMVCHNVVGQYSVYTY